MGCRILINEIVDKLGIFGLTHRQASVYVAIIELGCARIDQISESTGIHPQDIYKIAIKLEKDGLVNRTFSKPLMVEALPIEAALNRRLISEKEQTKKRIAEMEGSFEEIKKSLNRKQKTREADENTGYIYLLEGMNNATDLKICLALEDVETQFDGVLPTDPFYIQDLNHVKNWFRILGKNKGVKIRIIVAPKNEPNPNATNFRNKQLFAYAETLKRVLPPTANFELKALLGEDKIYFVILDSKEVWLILRFGNKTSTIVTSNRELINLAKDEFDVLWNSPKLEDLKTNFPTFVRD